MTILTMPNLTPTTQTFELITNTKTFTSPITGAVQTTVRKGSRWKTTMTFNNLSSLARAELQGFITRLNGQEHRFYARDFGALRLGSAPGTDSPTIFDMRTLGFPDIAQQDRVVLTNVTGGVSNYLRAGDYISFNNELHMITRSMASIAEGRVSAYISPNLRTMPAVGDAVDITEATSVFMMTNTPKWTTVAPNFSSITIEAIEDVLA